MHNILAGLRSLFRRGEESREMDEELRDYLNRSVEDKLRRGRSAREARVELASFEPVKESMRDAGWESTVESLWRDLRFGARILIRRPAFTVVAALSLAVGIAANTSIFSVFDALMLRRLPVSHPEALYTLQRHEGQMTSDAMSYRWYERFRALNNVFADAAAITNEDRSNVEVNGVRDERQVQVGLVTGNYFAVIGAEAAIGRTFTASDDVTAGGHPVVVLSDQYWRKVFGGDPSVPGRRLRLNQTTYTVLGVMPRAFSGEWVGRPTDFWIPISMLAQVLTELPPDPVRGGRMNYVPLVRLRPDVSGRQAMAAVAVVYQDIWKERLGANPSPEMIRQARQSRLDLVPAEYGFSPQRAALSKPIAILIVSAGLLLLITCANVANLLIARTAGREREIAVRLALGGGQARILRQLLVESLLLAALGGALGMLFAVWASGALLGLVATGPAQMGGGITPDPLRLEVHMDSRMLGFTFALSLVTGMTFGIIPAFRASKGFNQRGADGLARRGFLGKSLMVTQVALSLILLIGAALFSRTLHNLQTQDLGLDRRHTLLAWTSLRQGARIFDRASALFDQVPDRLALLPGVQSSSASVYGLLNGSESAGVDAAVAGQPLTASDDAKVLSDLVTPRYFESLELHMLAGRDFDARDDAHAPRVVIVNEALARRFFGRSNPVGQRIDFGSVASNRSIAGGPLTGRTFEIVGVVADSIHVRPRDRSRMMIYRPYRQDPAHLVSMCVVVRTVGEAGPMIDKVRQEVRRIDSGLPVLLVDTVDQQLSDLLVQERLIATLSGFFGGAAVLLACVGLYGLVSYSVAQRTNEIGVRIAVGAVRAHILRLVLGETLRLVGAGIAIGVPLALVATRAIAAQLFGVGTSDPVSMLCAAALLSAVAITAAWIPARRAASVDPVTALRSE